MFDLTIDTPTLTIATRHERHSHARAELLAYLDSLDADYLLTQATAAHTSYLLTAPTTASDTPPRLVGVATIEPVTAREPGDQITVTTHTLVNTNADVWHLNHANGQFVTAVRAGCAIEAAARAGATLRHRSALHRSGHWLRRGADRYSYRRPRTVTAAPTA